MAELFAPVSWDAPTVAAPATPAATPQKADNAAVSYDPRPAVATVASVADWRGGVRAFRKFDRPDFMSGGAWLTLQADASALAQIWAEELIGFGWSVPELFGWHPKPWCSAVMPSGLVRFLDRRPLGRYGPDEIEITQRLGASLMFRRANAGCSAPIDRGGAVPIWIAFSPGYLACH